MVKWKMYKLGPVKTSCSYNFGNNGRWNYKKGALAW